MAFDFKKEYKEFYLPPATPTVVDVPPMNYVAVRGKGIGKIKAFAAQNGLSLAIDDVRRHHEIYLSDPRKTVVDKLRTVIRYPVR